MMKSVLKTGFKETTNYVNASTGEVLEIEENKHTYIANSKEQFFLGYVTMLSVFLRISGPSIKTYSYLLMNYQVGTLIGINKGVKEDIMKQTSLKLGTINNAIQDLVKSNLLLRKENSRGSFYINPRYAFKGSTLDRKKCLKAIIELGFTEA